MKRPCVACACWCVAVLTGPGCNPCSPGKILSGETYRAVKRGLVTWVRSEINCLTCCRTSICYYCVESSAEVDTRVLSGPGCCCERDWEARVRDRDWSSNLRMLRAWTNLVKQRFSYYTIISRFFMFYWYWWLPGTLRFDELAPADELKFREGIVE